MFSAIRTPRDSAAAASPQASRAGSSIAAPVRSHNPARYVGDADLGPHGVAVEELAGLPGQLGDLVRLGRHVQLAGALEPQSMR